MKKAHIITVHGTWGAEEKADKPNWWQPNSRFSGWLIDCLRKQGIEAEIEPFKWSGENSDFQRDKAATDFASVIEQNKNPCSNIHIIAHSHGGNVIEQAMVRVWRDRHDRQRQNFDLIRSISSVGTPYFKKGALVSPNTQIILWSIGFIVALSVFYRSIYEEPIHELLASAGTLYGAQRIAFVLVCIATMVAFVFAIASFRPVIRPILLDFINSWNFSFEPRRANVRWLSIWHPNDEAIFGLQLVERERAETFTDEAAKRAISRALLLLLYACGIVFWPIFAIIVETTSDAAIGYLAVIAAPPLVILMFVAIISQYWVPKIITRNLNSIITNTIRGAILGQDQFERLYDVSVRPHQYKGWEYCVDAELANAMSSSARAKLVSYIEKTHEGLMFLNSSPSGVGFLAETANNLKGGELIHTSYFDYEEIAERIADHIAAHTE